MIRFGVNTWEKNGYKGYGTTGIGEKMWYDSVTVIEVITVVRAIRAQMKME